MRRPLFVLFVVVSLGALAEPRRLYVRVKNARVLGQPSLKATPVAELQPGAQVTWLGADPATKQLHKVDLGDAGVPAHQGWMLQATLSPRPPAPEYLGDDGKPIDAQAFESSGAAAKAVGPMPQAYAEKKKLPGAPQALLTAEAISATITPEALQARARGLGLSATAAEPATDPKATKPARKKKGGTK